MPHKCPAGEMLKGLPDTEERGAWRAELDESASGSLKLSQLSGRRVGNIRRYSIGSFVVLVQLWDFSNMNAFQPARVDVQGRSYHASFYSLDFQKKRVQDAHCTGPVVVIGGVVVNCRRAMEACTNFKYSSCRAADFLRTVTIKADTLSGRQHLFADAS